MAGENPQKLLRRRTADLRVALVHDWLNGMRGGEKVFEEVCRLFPDADVFTLQYEPAGLSSRIRSMNIVEHPWMRRLPPAARRRYRWMLPLMPRMAESFPTAEYDLVISTSHCVAKGAPPPRHGAHLSYVFSPMRYVWDHFEDYLGGGAAQDFMLKRMRERLQEWDRRTAGRPDALAADSAHIAEKIARFWNRKSAVIHPPVDTEFFTPGDPQDVRDEFLVVAALVPYKRVDRAIRAADLAEKRLLVVGDGPERQRLEALAGPGVRFAGWLPPEKLRTAYRRCRALIYPGTEDFGITALEAQACGRPVLALRQGGALETVEDGVTGAFFNEPEEGALGEAMEAFDPPRYDPADCRARAETFSPEAFRDQFAGWVLKEADLRCW